MRRSRVALAITAGIVVATAPSMALADTGTRAKPGGVTIQHAITCSWARLAGPFKNGTAVNGTVGVNCSDRLDDANTSAQLQRYSLSSGSFYNVGTAVVSYSTSTAIRVTDGAPGQNGTWRVRGDHFGQHGNIFALPTYLSPETYLWY